MKIKKSDYLTMTVVAERLGCEPDALKIIEAIERLKKRRPSISALRDAGYAIIKDRTDPEGGIPGRSE